MDVDFIKEKGYAPIISIVYTDLEQDISIDLKKGPVQGRDKNKIKIK